MINSLNWSSRPSAASRFKHSQPANQGKPLKQLNRIFSIPHSHSTFHKGVEDPDSQNRFQKSQKPFLDAVLHLISILKEKHWSHQHPGGWPPVLTVLDSNQVHMSLVTIQLVRLPHAVSYAGPVWGAMPAAEHMA
eukprot:1140615-Pelagomonas_calceolata.AAC.8